MRLRNVTAIASATVMFACATVPGPRPDAEAEARATAILDRAREALGGSAAVADVATVFFSADCEGPTGEFITQVASARDGRVAMVQTFATPPHFAAGIGPDGPWQQAANGAIVDSLGTQLAGIVTGHELHLLALAPESRYTAPIARPTQTLYGRDVNVVDARDERGTPIRFFYDIASGLPAGFQPIDDAGSDPILTRFTDWRQVDDVLLPFSITITQGADVFIYRVTEASVNSLTDDDFRPSTAPV